MRIAAATVKFKENNRRAHSRKESPRVIVHTVEVRIAAFPLPVASEGASIFYSSHCIEPHFRSFLT